jgi:hypothetical protein
VPTTGTICFSATLTSGNDFEFDYSCSNAPAPGTVTLMMSPYAPGLGIANPKSSGRR